MKELISKTKYNQPKVIPLLTIQCLKTIYLVVWSVWISEELESLLNNKVVKNIAFRNVFFSYKCVLPNVHHPLNYGVTN